MSICSHYVVGGNKYAYFPRASVSFGTYSLSYWIGKVWTQCTYRLNQSGVWSVWIYRLVCFMSGVGTLAFALVVDWESLVWEGFWQFGVLVWLDCSQFCSWPLAALFWLLLTALVRLDCWCFCVNFWFFSAFFPCCVQVAGPLFLLSPSPSLLEKACLAWLINFGC